MRSRAGRRVRSCGRWRMPVVSSRCARTVGRKSSRDLRPSRRWRVSSRVDRSRVARARNGFTLIELLVTIAIIATLAAIVAPSLFSNVGQARQNAAKSQIQILSLALDAYRVDNDAYPTTEQGLEALRSIPLSSD